MEEKAKISRILLLILLRLSKKVLENLEFFKEKNNKINYKENAQKRQSYIQVSALNINKIMKIKDSFSKLSSKKIKKIYKVVNEKNEKSKPRIN